MKRISLFIASFVFAAVFAGSTLAQTPTPVKIGLINTYDFGDEKAGIIKYVNAVKSLNAEFTPVQLELDTMNKRLTALAKEIQLLREQAASGKVPIDERAAQAKVEEGEKLQRDIKFKQEDAKARYERRQQAVMGPVMLDIDKAINDFAKQKGFTLIFDIAKNEGLLVAVGDEKIEITKDFIAFYNARPAATATTAAPPPAPKQQ